MVHEYVDKVFLCFFFELKYFLTLGMCKIVVTSFELPTPCYKKSFSFDTTLWCDHLIWCLFDLPQYKNVIQDYSLQYSSLIYCLMKIF
jgi:hypothetical protein